MSVMIIPVLLFFPIPLSRRLIPTSAVQIKLSLPKLLSVSIYFGLDHVARLSLRSAPCLNVGFYLI